MFKLLRKIPLTLFYILLNWAFNGIVSQQGEEIHAASIVIPIGGGIPMSYYMMFQLVAVILLWVELTKSSQFRPRENNADAFLSIGVGIVYLLLMFTTSYFQTEFFFFLTLLTFMDVVIGLLAILGISRRSIDTDIGQ